MAMLVGAEGGGPMTKFRYEGHDKDGKAFTGEIEAKDEAQASEKLRERGIYAMKIEPDGPGPMRTILPGNDRGVSRRGSAPADTTKDECPSDAGRAPTISGPAERNPSDWRDELLADLQAASDVFRQVEDWRSSDSGPNLGGKTWALLDLEGETGRLAMALVLAKAVGRLRTERD